MWGDGPYCVMLDIVKLDNTIKAQNSQKMVVGGSANQVDEKASRRVN